MQSTGHVRPISPSSSSSARRLFGAAIALAATSALAGCAGLLNSRPNPTYDEQIAAREQCFRSYLQPAGPPNPKAPAKLRAWYASLTREIVEQLADDATFNQFAERVIAHATAAGVPEGDFVAGPHPDPSPPCGLKWNYEDVGDNRFGNAASVATSVLRRARFATCSAQFDAVGPRLATLAGKAVSELSALGADADPQTVWSAYHRLMAEHTTIMPKLGDEDTVPPFAYAGAPYVVYADLVNRYGGTPWAFLVEAWLGGVSPFPDHAPRWIMPLSAADDDARLQFCADTMQREGQLYSDFESDDLIAKFGMFDGQAWFDGLPADKRPAQIYHASTSDNRPGMDFDRSIGPDDETFRVYLRPITAASLKGGKGTVDLTLTTRDSSLYACKDVVKIKPEADGSSTLSHEQVCKTGESVRTDKLTLTVGGLPPGLTLAAGDELVFFARRTATDRQEASKPTKAGSALFTTITSTADLVFLAQARRGTKVLYPTPNF